jgi:hypothetical protein
MASSPARINQATIQVRHVCWTPPSCPCDRCGQPAASVWEAGRTAIDIDLDRPVPWAGNVAHREGNSAAHIKAILVGSSVQVLVEDGVPQLA